MRVQTFHPSHDADRRAILRALAELGPQGQWLRTAKAGVEQALIQHRRAWVYAHKAAAGRALYAARMFAKPAQTRAHVRRCLARARDAQAALEAACEPRPAFQPQRTRVA